MCSRKAKDIKVELFNMITRINETVHTKSLV